MTRTARAAAGDEVAEDLGIPNPLWKHAVSLTYAVVSPLEALRERLPGATWISALGGNLIWQTAVDQELKGKRPRFEATAEHATLASAAPPRPAMPTETRAPQAQRAYPSWKVPA